MGACTNSQVKGQAFSAQKKVIEGKINSEQQKCLDENFAGCIRSHVLEELTFKKLDQLGFTDENTLFADSTCPDEINHADPTEDVTALFRNRWGELFPLGGLAGLPFTG